MSIVRRHRRRRVAAAAVSEADGRSVPADQDDAGADLLPITLTPTSTTGQALDDQMQFLIDGLSSTSRSHRTQSASQMCLICQQIDTDAWGYMRSTGLISRMVISFGDCLDDRSSLLSLCAIVLTMLDHPANLNAVDQPCVQLLVMILCMDDVHAASDAIGDSKAAPEAVAISSSRRRRRRQQVSPRTGELSIVEDLIRTIVSKEDFPDCWSCPALLVGLILSRSISIAPIFSHIVVDCPSALVSLTDCIRKDIQFIDEKEPTSIIEGADKEITSGEYPRTMLTSSDLRFRVYRLRCSMVVLESIGQLEQHGLDYTVLVPLMMNWLSITLDRHDSALFGESVGAALRVLTNLTNRHFSSCMILATPEYARILIQVLGRSSNMDTPHDRDLMAYIIGLLINCTEQSPQLRELFPGVKYDGKKALVPLIVEVLEKVQYSWHYAKDDRNQRIAADDSTLIQDQMIAGYVCLLIGCMCDDHEVNIHLFRKALPQQSFSTVADTLNRFSIFSQRVHPEMHQMISDIERVRFRVNQFNQ